MKAILERLFAHETLSVDEAHNLMLHLTQGEASEPQAAALLAAYRMRNITVDELYGFRCGLVEQALPVDLSAYRAIDIVGTGGDGKNTFNISTCACFVVAAAGQPVAKHGNFGASSVSGASTVLQNHGVVFTNDESKLHRSIEGCGMAYLHAPKFHPALAKVGPLRKALGFSTFFNLLGPLVNPSKPAFQMLGVASLGQQRLYSQTLQRVGIGFTIVNSLDGYDEISLTADFKVANNLFDHVYTPSDLGFASIAQEELWGGNTAEEAAKIFDNVLAGQATAAQTNCVVANAAFGLKTARPETSVEDCVAAAREALESGCALATFKKFVELNS